MSKKQVEKLINKIDVDNNFDKINKQIDYSKYVKENKNLSTRKSKVNSFAVTICSIAAAYTLVIGLLAINHLSVKKYNDDLINQSLSVYDINNKSLLKIESKEDYAKYVDVEIFLKESFVDKIVSFFEKTVAPKDYTNGSISIEENIEFEGVTDDEVNSDAAVLPGTNIPEEGNNSSYQTNVQETGIDESDVSKCDGKYIYTFNCNNNKLSIFDMNANMVTYTKVDDLNYYSYWTNISPEIYVSNDDVILTSQEKIKIYTFDGSTLKLKDTFSYQNLIDSRLTNNTLYFVASEKLIEENLEYENVYYDGISYIGCVFNIIKYDLSNNTFEKVECLNSYESNIYMSEKNIYLATTTYVNYQLAKFKEYDVVSNFMYRNITSVAVFDYDLNPVGTIKLLGSVLNQFSMDEHDNYFRIVTTDSSMPEEQLNSISIFDLSTFERVGYLNQGIGLQRQIVKSVRYDDNTCYVVTYENTDPLYEIDLSDVTNPTIVSIYKAPGWSNYLHTFEINGEKYLFGIGYTDDRYSRKISVYKDDEQTTQIGKDFIISDLNVNPDLFIDSFLSYNLNNHKALFIYNDATNLYLGVNLSNKTYYIFKIDVTAEDVVSIYKKIDFQNEYYASRAYLVNGFLYVTGFDTVYKEEF